MSNTYFSFKQFTINQDKCAMKVTTDACLFGAWCAAEMKNLEIKNCLDIGTGTGLLTLMIAQQNEFIVDAIEIDEPAASQAETNVAASPFKNKINIINSDIRLYSKESYNAIISNPPFYENELAAVTDDKNTAHHSLHLNLKSLFSIIAKKLTADGYFFLLLPFKRKNEVESLLKQEQLQVQTIVYVKHSINHAPFRLMIKGAKKITEKSVEEIVICDVDNQYTPRFTTLLKDYYLYL